MNGVGLISCRHFLMWGIPAAHVGISSTRARGSRDKKLGYRSKLCRIFRLLEKKYNRVIKGVWKNSTIEGQTMDGNKPLRRIMSVTAWFY